MPSACFTSPIIRPQFGHLTVVYLIFTSSSFSSSTFNIDIRFRKDKPYFLISNIKTYILSL